MTRPAGDTLRIVHLINHLGFGGTERQLFLTLKHLRGEPFEHRVVVFNPSPHQVYDAALEALGIEVSSIPETCRGAFSRLLFLSRELRRWKPHVVHSWTLHDNIYAALAGWWSGARVRWGSARLSLSSPGFRQLPAILRYLSVRSVQRLVVNSRSLVGEAGELLAEERIFHLPNCVELPASEVPEADLSELGIGSREMVIGTIGNLRRRKNQIFFVRAMHHVVQEHPDTRALIVGQAIESQPEIRARIEEEIDRLGLAGRVILAGFRDDVPEILARLSVVCLTSRHEGLPNVVLEAMAVGRPVVALDVDGVPELVEHGQNGLLVEPGNEEEFAAAILRLLDEPSRARAMGRAGRRRAEREFSCPGTATRLAEAYRDAVAQSGIGKSRDGGN